MKISPTDSYEVKKKKLEKIPESRHHSVLDALANGQTVDISTAEEILNDPMIPALTQLLKNKELDLTKHEDLYYLINRRIIPLQQMLKRKVYEPYRKHAAKIRELNQENNGFTDARTMRHIGALPPDVYQIIVEQYPDANERSLVVQWLLKTPEGRPYATVEKGF